MIKHRLSKKISVVLPTYNEAGNIVPLIKQILAVCFQHKLVCEVIVVDDNSPDQTAIKVKSTFHNNLRIKVIVRTHKRGLAASIAQGIKVANHSIVLVMDTDFNHDPKVIPVLVQKLAQADIVIGSRFVGSGGMENKTRYYLSLIYNLFIRLFLGLPTTDNLSGFFATRKLILKHYLHPVIFSGFGEYFVRLLYHLHREGKTITEIPVYYVLRHHGQRKSQFLKMFTTYSHTVIKLKLSASVIN